MNLAFSALLVVLLATPGALFLGAYRRGFNDKPHQTSTFQTNLFLYLLFALPLHALGVAGYLLGAWLVRLLRQGSPTSFPLSGGDVLTLLVGTNAPDYAASLARLEANLGTLFIYTLCLFLLAVGIGLGMHRFVRAQALDLRFPIINPQGTYWALFSADQRRLSRSRYIAHPVEGRESDAPDFILVTVGVEQGDEAYLYWGILLDYALGSGNRLERLVLGDAQRRALASDLSRGDERAAPQYDARFYPILGDSLVIEYNHVKTMNVQYVYLLEQDDQGADEDEAESNEGAEGG